jgi:hypothetical protein
MNPTDLANFKRAIERLGFQNKSHLGRKDVDRLIEELSLDREYKLADYIRSLDPATIAALLRY